ncbi:hypothetical protein DFH06DRAFT_1183385 [Mycena polygramma]|nr:hypothetical protein DFH06DRAFT_1183385 [Mycena polygramma]
MTGIQVHSKVSVSSLESTNLPIQFIEIANSSTKGVESRVPLLHLAHSDKSNEHREESKHNGFGVLGTPKHSIGLAGYGFASANAKDIFSALKQSRVDPSIDTGALWHNIAPSIQHELVQDQTLNSQGPILTQSSDYKHQSASVWQQAPQPSTSIGGLQPAKFVDDFKWLLGDGLQVIQNQLKFNSHKATASPPFFPSPLKEGTQVSAEGTPFRTPNTLSKRKRSLSAKVADRTIFTPPPLPISTIDPDHLLPTRDVGPTPNSPATSAPSSPIFTDTSSRRAWSPISHESLCSPATTPPLSPAAAEASSNRGWLSNEICSKKDTPKIPTSSDEDASNLFGDDSPIVVPQHADVHKLFDEDVSVDKHVAKKPITRRPIEELKAYTAPYRKKTTTRRHKKTRVIAKPRAARSVVPSISHAFTSKQPTFSHGVEKPQAPVLPSAPVRHMSGMKRPASPARPPPAKRQAIWKPLPESKLAEWASALLTFEELAYQGKQAPSEIGRLVKLIKGMAAKMDMVPDAWVSRAVRTRTVDGLEERKNKHQLLQDVVGSYSECDETVKSHAKELLVKWSAECPFLSSSTPMLSF